MKSVAIMNRPAYLVAAVFAAVALIATPTALRAQQPPEAPSTASDNAQDDPIDFQRARQLLMKVQRGEKLTDQEQAYLDRARAARQAGMARPPQPAPDAASERESVGFKPLTEMTADDRYKQQDGGLYGAGRNTPPDAHQALAEKAIARIRPLDAEGNPAADGKVALISIGMSNTTQEFSQFIRQYRGDKRMAPHLVLVDGAQGGMTGTDWARSGSGDTTDARGRNPWQGLEQRLRGAEVSDRQVQVAWVKLAERQPALLGEYPQHANRLADNIAHVSTQLKQRFPNLQVVYVSSRIYAGYARGNLNPEPFAYESAFAVRSAIQRQIDGDAQLNADPDRGTALAPVLLWGPYLWADGTTPRQADQFTWNRSDLAADGTHPSATGQRKVAELLWEFFTSDPLARRWFVNAASR